MTDDRHIDAQCETIAPHHYCVVAYKAYNILVFG